MIVLGKIRLEYKVLAFFTCLILGITANTINTSALSGSDFNPGRIIDDSVFYNSTSMNQSQVQAFLNSKLPTCDTNGNQMYNSTQTRAQWAAANGRPLPPYTCLKDYSQTVPTVTNSGSDLCKNSIAGGTKLASQIIVDVANACGINPQTLIVLLQKEQSLITDDWPWPVQYQSATGYGCPDTAPCDAEFYGFFNQVYQAAKAYRRYEANPNSYNYKASRNNFIYYNPNLSGCGGSNVFIENQATASLYIYTPYQPNSAALNNLYGSGDSCSAYGNRNFWRLFNDWFGSTSGPEFQAQYLRQSSYKIAKDGAPATVYLDYKNTGRAFWKDDLSTFPGYRPTRLMSTEPLNRASSFYDSSWLSTARPTGVFAKVYESDGVTLSPDQHTVFPNQIGRFEFKMNGSSSTNPGVYREYFQPIIEGAPDYSWNMGGVSYVDIGYHKDTYKAEYVSQSTSPIISPEFSSAVFLQFKNTGNASWYDDASVPSGKYPVHLATSSPINRSSIFADGWASTGRVNLTFTKVYEANGTTLATNQHVVAPGQIARFEFSMKNSGNVSPGYYQEYFEPILEGAPGYSWNMGAKALVNVGIPPSIYKATYHSQSSYPTLTLASPSSTAFVQFKNSGNVKWYDDMSVTTGKLPVHLATSWPINRSSKFANGWFNAGRPNLTFTKVYEANGTTLATNQHVVAPGQIARFEFSMKNSGNVSPGYYQEYFEPILEGAPGYSWNMGATVWLGLTVTN